MLDIAFDSCNITHRMNRLDTAKRAQILLMLLKGTSMRAIAQTTGVSINTVTKLLTDAGAACATYHDKSVRGIGGYRRIECDEIWSFDCATDRSVSRAKLAPKDPGSVWTWTALDADTKLVVSYLVCDGRDGTIASEFLDDLRNRAQDRIQLSTDGLGAYLKSLQRGFGDGVNYVQVLKDYAPLTATDNERCFTPRVFAKVGKRRTDGHSDVRKVTPQYLKGPDPSMRRGKLPFMRVTNTFPKKVEKHAAMISLYFVHYNFCRIHKTLRVTPAMEAGLSDTVHDMDWIVGLVDARAPKPSRPKTYKTNVSN